MDNASIWLLLLGVFWLLREYSNAVIYYAYAPHNNAEKPRPEAEDDLISLLEPHDMVQTH
jgi:hypothetical protein